MQSRVADAGFGGVEIFCSRAHFDYTSKTEARDIGGALAPAAKSVLGEMAVGLTALQQTLEANKEAVSAYFTSLIELAWSKRRIIEIYLNVVEWAPGIYGAEAAAEHYFRKTASRLTVAEAARLAAVLPDPLDRSASRPGGEVRDRAAFILRQLPNLPASQPLPCGEPF